MASPPVLKTASPTAPRYFSLLWDHELDDLRRVVEALSHKREQVLARWHELYVLHLGDSRTLSEAEFHEIFGLELDATVKNVLAKDMDQFAADVIKVGDKLAARGVPFSEVIISTHLFEESAGEAFPAFPPLLPKIYMTFDKLSHCRMIVLVDRYFRSQSALGVARVKELEREVRKLPPEARSSFRGLVGASPPMHQLYDRIEAAGQTRGTVLIVGESGSGKELVARAIHESGSNPGTPFVALNCAAIPRDLIESELFGYKRGAFSGANAEYLGLFRAAHNGTLFLDEVTEMSPETQSKLLRALQERLVRPVGSTKEVPVDVRLIASTNREPEEAMRSGRLRQDLYYRLQASMLRVPPLREHPEDVELLADHFITLFNEKLRPGMPIRGIEEAAVDAMKAYQWRGNVRELSNAIESAFTFGRSQVIRLSDLPPEIGNRRAAAAALAPASGAVGTFAEVERDLIARALESTGGNKVAAAKLLRISRKKLYDKISKYGLT